MTYVKDLTPITLFDCYPGDGVGWLEPEYEYPTGDVEPAFVSALAELFMDPWAPAVYTGYHYCRFCDGETSHSYVHNGQRILLGNSNLFLPTPTALYLAPSLILHYITEHQYAPPTVFVDAVLACPQMGSPEYVAMLELHGVGPMTKELRFYRAMVWSGDGPGQRVSVLAKNLDEAHRILEVQHGAGNLHDLHNEEDANRRR